MDTPRMGMDDALAKRLSMAEQYEYLRAKLSRRRVIRGGVAAAGVAAGTGLLASSSYAAFAGTAGTTTAGSPGLLTAPATGRVDGSLVTPFGRLRKGSGIDFIVVFFHHCAYSTTSAHASEGGVREAWVPLFEKHGVDLVINGHNHVYERTDAIKAGVVSRKAPIGTTVSSERDGIVYVTAGGAGKTLYSFPVPDSYQGQVADLEGVDTYHWAKGQVKATETVEWSRVRYTGYSFLAVEVEPAPAGRTTKLVVSALAESGARVDHFTVARRAE